jgi:hypothetical protein
MLAGIILTVICMYLLSGLVFALAFVTKGAGKIDEAAHESGTGFKIIIIPGTIVFWPVLMKKWLNVTKKNHHD